MFVKVFLLNKETVRKSLGTSTSTSKGIRNIYKIQPNLQNVLKNEYFNHNRSKPFKAAYTL